MATRFSPGACPKKAWGQISGTGKGLFQHNPFNKQQCSLEALTGKYLVLTLPCQLNQASAENDNHDSCRAQWEEHTGEGQSFGVKDIITWGPVDTHWSHVYINSVRDKFRIIKAYPFSWGYHKFLKKKKKTWDFGVVNPTGATIKATLGATINAKVDSQW